MKRQESRAVIAWRGAANAGLVLSADRAYMKAPVPRPTPDFGTKWCAPRQVDSEIIYILRMKILPAYHMVLGAMQPVDGHGLP